MANGADKYNTAKEVASYLGVTVQAVYSWRKTRGFPQGEMWGTARRFKGSEVEDWIKERRGARV